MIPTSLPFLILIQALLAQSLHTFTGPSSFPAHSLPTDSIKYNGTGFGPDLRSAFSEAITDAAIYFTGNFPAQAKFISEQMKSVKSGDWNIVVIAKLNITRITDVSTGFSYWS
jgi:hypothetical protein